jgi:aryl-alcohol dehydrogenase-like predicted oxidoreductase
MPEQDLEEGWSAMSELREEGLVRHIGVSNFTAAQVRRVASIAPVGTLQPPYSLIARDVEEEILPFAEREGIGVIVYSPMGSGLLTGRMTAARIQALADDDWRKHDARFREPQLSAHLATAAGVSRVAARLGVAPGAIAIAWTLRNPAVDGAIVGLRRPDQVDELLAGATLELSDHDAVELERTRR